MSETNDRRRASGAKPDSESSVSPESPVPALDVERYLDRISYIGSLEPTAETLDALHQAHLFSVPFENLNIHNNLAISLEPEQLYRKIVEQRRGGFCYELNGLFSRLLKELGYQVTLLSAGVKHKSDESYGPEFDHLTLLVELEQRWLADVGFGIGFRHPLLLDNREKQEQEVESYKFIDEDDYVILMRRKYLEDWRPAYRFKLVPRQYDDFLGMCRYHTTSPESPFLKHPLIVMDQPDGKMELMDRRFTRTFPDGSTEQHELDDAAYKIFLREKFGVVIP